MTSKTTVYPSGAKVTVTERPGWRMTHWEMPCHQDCIYSRLTLREAPNSVDIPAAARASGRDIGTSVGTSGTVPHDDSQQTLKK